LQEKQNFVRESASGGGEGGAKGGKAALTIKQRGGGTGSKGAETLRVTIRGRKEHSTGQKGEGNQDLGT